MKKIKWIVVKYKNNNNNNNNISSLIINYQFIYYLNERMNEGIKKKMI